VSRGKSECDNLGLYRFVSIKKYTGTEGVVFRSWFFRFVLDKEAGKRTAATRYHKTDVSASQRTNFSGNPLKSKAVTTEVPREWHILCVPTLTDVKQYKQRIRNRFDGMDQSRSAYALVKRPLWRRAKVPVRITQRDVLSAPRVCTQAKYVANTPQATAKAASERVRYHLKTGARDSRCMYPHSIHALAAHIQGSSKNPARKYHRASRSSR
jgi:hypothetical protein